MDWIFDGVEGALNAFSDPAFQPLLTTAAKEHRKPPYLYHGSQYRFDKVIPHAASGECDRESRTAIYAAETVDEVIPFALPIRWYPDSPEGKRSFSCSGGLTKLDYGSLDPEGIGYVYKLKSDSFEKIDGWQWISEQEVVPEEVMEIRAKDYWDRVIFSEEAKKINESLYHREQQQESTIG